MSVRRELTLREQWDQEYGFGFWHIHERWLAVILIAAVLLGGIIAYVWNPGARYSYRAGPGGTLYKIDNRTNVVTWIRGTNEQRVGR